MLISLCSAAQVMQCRIKKKFLKQKNFGYSFKENGWINFEDSETGQLYTNFAFFLSFHINTCENKFGWFMQDKLSKTSIAKYQNSHLQLTLFAGPDLLSGGPGTNKTLAASISNNKFRL
jgi:hypothetical protein